MKTNRSRLPMLRRLVLGSLALLTLLSFGTAFAAVPTSAAYHFSSHPMISGTVVSVNDHQLVVNTDQGEQVALEVDSRTMAPRDLAPGMVMRVEFLALEDCRFYAQRVMPLRDGASTSRLQAYANTQDSREAIARSNGDLPMHGGSAASAVSRSSLPQTVGPHSPGTVMTATRNTADYHFSSGPMVSGSVLSVNDHRLVIQTDQGQRLGMVMDSRTLVPGEVQTGTVVRTEFTRLEDGRYYAKRVSTIADGVAAREPAYAHTRDSEFVIAEDLSDCGFVNVGSGNAVTSALEPRSEVVKTEPVVVQSVPVPDPAPAPVVAALETLPQTASSQPLILMLGLLALGAAGLVTVVRGLRIA